MHTNIKFSYLTILCVAIFFSNSVLAKEQNSAFKDVSILVSSCDKYSQFWSPFFTALEKNWPELSTVHKDVKMYLIANSKTYPSSKVKTINIPNEISWSDNMLTALEQIKTKYVLLFLDDYWIELKVDNARMQEIIYAMAKEDAAYLQLFVDDNEGGLVKPVQYAPGVAYKNKFQKYRTSLQLALWETKALKQILRSGESAWDFELAASIRSSGYPKEFLTLRSNMPIFYLNASHQGHITPLALELAKVQDENFVNTMPVLQDNQWRLKVKHMKHKVNSLVALVERNLFKKDEETYRYKFEKRS